MSYTPLILNNREYKLCLKLKEINLLLTKFELPSLTQLEKFLSEQVTNLNLINIFEILKICASRNHTDFNIDLDELELSDMINITNAIANEFARSLNGGTQSKEKEGTTNSGKSKK
jgi:hypothetical protein